MAINKKLLVKPPSSGLTPSEHFGVVLYEGDGASSHSINGGKFGAGAHTNGSNSNLTYPEETFDINKSHTVSGWVNLSVLANEDMLFYNHDTNVRLNSNYSVKYRRNLVNTAHDIDSSTTLSANTWYHIVFTFSTTSGMTLYINGSSEGTDSYTGNASNHSSDYGLMYRADTGGQRTKGKIDQVRIFTKALSSSEVSTLYAETTPESLSPLGNETVDTLQVLGDTSCVATYRFENNEDDLSGNYNGTGTEIEYAAGRYGQAAKFDGSDSFVDTNYTLPADSTHSVSLWFKTTVTGSQQYIYSDAASGGSDTSTRLSIGINSSNNFVLIISNGSSSWVNSSVSASSYQGGSWHNLVITVNGTAVKLYLNNSLLNTYTSTISAGTAGAQSFTIGRLGDDNSNYFNGEIDQVRIFNKAISASEVATLYNENPLVASYRFEGNANDDMRTYNGTASNVTYEYGLNFTPDLVWVKDRSATYGHRLIDSTTGTDKYLESSSTSSQQGAGGNGLISFDTGGFTVGSGNAHNKDGDDFVAWAFKANGGTTSSNTDGTITSTVQANQDAGFSIISYTGSGSAGSVGHGISAGAPDLVIIKRLDGTTYWQTWYNGAGTVPASGINRLYLNDTQANDSSTTNVFYPDATKINLNSGDHFFNTSSGNYIAYCFKSTDGFSKFGSYTGNGVSGGGPIIETGFEPAFLMIKNTNTSSYGWYMFDNKRNPGQEKRLILRADTTGAEYDGGYYLEFLSNGFRINTNSGPVNLNNGTFIYMAFAADPDTEAPTVAKSFNTVTWAGNQTARDISVGFKPGLVWIKGIASNYGHRLYDTIRGAGNAIYTNSTDAQGSSSARLTAFNDDGFSLGTDAYVNNGGVNFVGWSWKADDNEATIEEVTEDADAIAIYKFEDNANDVTGDHNGTASGVSYVSGKFNKAASFDNNANTKITIGTLSSVIPNNTTGVSFSFWVYLDSVDTNSNYDHWFIGQEDYGGAFGDGEFSVRLYEGKVYTDYAQSSTIYRQRKASTVLSTGQWYHIVATYDTSNANITEVYLNGVLETSSNVTSGGTFTTTALMQNSSNMTIGGGGAGTDGEIDQFRIYDKVLNAASVTNLYNETVAQNSTLNIGTKATVSAQSIVSANANAGFSIVKYTGNGVAGTKIPHGLSAAPEVMIIKSLDSSLYWAVYHKYNTGSSGNSATERLKLPGTSATATTSIYWNSTAPTATEFTIGTDTDVNTNGDKFIAYCFHAVSNFSKFGSFTGTGTGTNQLINTGFQPDWVMFKDASAGGSWWMQDSVRGADGSLKANEDAGKTVTNYISFESNGFRVSGDANGTSTWVYFAFKIN